MSEPNWEHSWPIKMDASGRILVPAEARKIHGWDKDTHLVISESADGSLRLLTFDQFVESAQQYFVDKFGPGRSLVDELIAGRREEAAREESRH